MEPIPFKTVSMPVRRCMIGYLQWSRFLSTQSVCLLGIVSSATFNEANCSQDSQYACQELYDQLPSMKPIALKTVSMPVRCCMIDYLQWSQVLSK